MYIQSVNVHSFKMPLFALSALSLPLLLAIVQNSARATTETQAKQTINLLTMLPFPNPDPRFDPSWNEGDKVLPALYLARDQINNMTDLLPRHKLELISLDGGCDIAATTAVSTAMGLSSGESKTSVVGMVGPGCSSSAVQTGYVINQPAIELVQIHGGGSPLLADRNEYTNSLGILGSTQSFVNLSLALMRKTGWQNIAILFESNRIYYRSTKEAFVASLSSNTSVLFASPVYTSFYPLDGVRSSLARIVFVFTSSSHSTRIMCLAYHRRMIYPAYQWVIISKRLSDFVGETASLSDNITFSYDRQIYRCSLKEILSVALQGTFLLNYQLITATSYTRKVTNTTFDEFLDLYEQRAIESNVSTTYWSYYFYDAVWAWARVLHRMAVKNNEIFSNFQYGNKTLVSKILAEFYAHDFEFEGMSGLISFNSSTGFYDRPSDLYQIFNKIEKHVAYNNGTSIVKLQPFKVVPDLVRTLKGSLSIALVVTFGIVQFVELFAVVFLHVITVVYRNEKSVRASSPKLSHFAFVGTYILLFGLSLNIFIEIRTHSNIISGIVCQAIWGWIFPIGFTLTIGTVTVRTWRLYRIFAHYLDPGKFISNAALIVMLVILLCIDLTIAVVWTTVDPLMLVVMEESVQVGPSSELVLDRTCSSQYGWQGYASWLVIVMSIRIALLLVMVVLSVLTRHIPNKSFTTTSLRVFCYVFSVVFFMGFMLFYLFVYLNLNLNFEYAVLHIMLNTLIVLYMACVFIPPLSPVIHKKIQNFRENSVWLTSSRSNTKTDSLDEKHDICEPRVRKTSTDKLL